MKHHLPGIFFVCLIFTLTSCGNHGMEAEADEIRELERQLEPRRAAQTNNPDEGLKKDLNRLGELYDNFTQKYTEARECPDFLFRAGELYYKELKDYHKALSLFQRNYEQYPDHPTSAHALFLSAYIYQTELTDLIKAEARYKDFLEHYPDHTLAVSASSELEQMAHGEPEQADSISTDSIHISSVDSTE